MFARGGELGGGRSFPVGCAAHRHAAHSAENLEAHSAGRPRMIPQTFEYSAPQTLQEALGLIAGGDRKVLAGGMSLIPLMKLRLAAPDEVVDLARIPGLNGITESGGVVRIGDMATHREVETSAVIRANCPLLSETVGNIGDVQVRNQ